MKTKMMMLYVFLLVCVLTLSACIQDTKTLIDSDSLQVARTGTGISVYDRLGRDMYIFTIARRKRSERPQKASVLVRTDTLEVITIPGEGLKFVSGGMVYRITRKKGVI